MTDSAVDIEQFDSLLEYLRGTGRIEALERPQFRVLGGGVSNRTVWLQRASGEQWVLKQALPKLRVAVEWLSPPERIFRESLGMQCLGDLLPKGFVPRFVFEDREQFLFCMSAVPEPHRNWKEMLLEGDLVPDDVEQFALLLSIIHRQRHPKCAQLFGDTSFFESLRLEPYYLYTATQVPQAAAFLQALVDETRSTKLSLVHGDYSPKNILVQEGQLVLLDEEVIHFGDPAFDLGFSLTHLLSKAHHLQAHRASFASAMQGYWEIYSEMDPPFAASIEERAVRHTLGCLLARVDGRSPLEYLTESERNCQRTSTLALMADPPQSIPHLIDAFIESLD